MCKATLCWFAACWAVIQGRPFTSMMRDLNIIAQCNATSPVDKLILNKALLERTIQQEAKHPFDCFLYCIYSNYDWMSEDGQFHPENIKSLLVESTLRPGAAERLVYNCTQIANENKCERAFQFTKCFWSQSVLETERARAEDDYRREHIEFDYY